jgi:hypothetical protein
MIVEFISIIYYMDWTVCLKLFNSLCTNPLAWSLWQVKLDSDKWKLWKNLFE